MKINASRTLFGAPLSLCLCCAPAIPLSAQIEEGKVGKYLEFNPADSKKGERGVVQTEKYPALSIEDLRKITLYSQLAIRGTKIRIADTKYMRSIEAHPTNKDVLVVTSDHFRFTTLKSGQIQSKVLTKKERERTRFLWIKHATKEQAPDGKPWLKDLILLPYSPKTGHLLGRWPFSTERSEFDFPLFVTLTDPRPSWGNFPPPEKCVVGTFKSGRTSYLVVDVFGGYGWWGQVAATEFFPLRGKGAAVIDAFHGGAKDRRQKKTPPWSFQQWRNPQVRTYHEILGTNRAEVTKRIKELPAMMKIPVRSEKTGGFEDLLRLDQEQRPVKAVDDMIVKLRTFGDLMRWADDYGQKRFQSDQFPSWYADLEKLLSGKNKDGHITTMRVLRYAFRRMGFPARIQCNQYSRMHWYPRLGLHIYLPSQDVSWVYFPLNRVLVFRPETAQLWALPTIQDTRRGRIPIFDCDLAEMKGIRWYPRRGL